MVRLSKNKKYLRPRTNSRHAVASGRSTVARASMRFLQWHAVLAAAAMCALVACALRARPLTGGPVELVFLPFKHQMPPALDKQDCIKAGAKCTIRVSGGYLKLTDIAFPDGEDKPGSATADGVVMGKHVHGVVKLQGNQLPLGHFVSAREDPEPYIVARQHAEVGAADQDDKPPMWAETAAAPEGSPLEDEADLPGNASSIQRFSPKYGGAVLKRSRADLRHKFCKVTLIVTLIYQI